MTTMVWMTNDGGVTFARTSQTAFTSIWEPDGWVTGTPTGEAAAPLAVYETNATRRVGRAVQANSDTTIATNSTASLAGGGLTVTGTTNGGKYRAIIEAGIVNGTSGLQFLFLDLYLDGALVTGDTTVEGLANYGDVDTSNVRLSTRNRMIYEPSTAPSAGSHTWEVKVRSTAAVSSTIKGRVSLSVYELGE